MTPKWQKLANLAQEICTLYFQFYGAVFASKVYPFKNILYLFCGSFVLFMPCVCHALTSVYCCLVVT